jgi:hypothetical protein
VLGTVIATPPAEMPPAARHALDTDRARVTQGVLRTGALAYSSFLLVTLGFVPFAEAKLPVLGLAALIGALITALLVVAARGGGTSRTTLYVGLALHVVILGWACVLTSPLIVMPPVIIASMVTASSMPSHELSRLAAVGHALALVVPLVLEWVGVLPPTYRAVGHALVFEPWTIALDARVVVGLAVGAFLLQIIATTIIIVAQRRRQTEAEERVHLQAWHFAQLVPEDIATATSSPAPPRSTRSAT